MRNNYLLLSLFAVLLAGAVACASAHKDDSQNTESTGVKSSLPLSQVEPARGSREATKKIVVATVNGTEITMYDLVRMMNRIDARSRSAAASPEHVQLVQQQALDRLILQELAYQKAQSQGLRASTEAIDAALANFKTNMGGDKGYRRFLEKEQVTEQELRSQVERSLTLEHIYAQEVFRKVTIPDDELRKVYEQEKEKYIKPEKVSVVDVFFPIKNGGEHLAERAAAVHTRILQDKNRDPWQIPLDGTFIVRNYKPRQSKDWKLLEEARLMKIDQISPVIKAPDGYHIIKLREYTPERQLTFEEVKPRLENQLRVPAQNKRLREWEQELRKDATIEIVTMGDGNEPRRATSSD